MRVNPDFVGEIEKQGLPKDTEFLFICRSGARSAAAASALTAAGYSNCWNVAQGFEGDRDPFGHRAQVGGWKAAGLPWVQS
jgi:rhodanese-related sulfurtransferase